jgi:hypothetical protein
VWATVIGMLRGICAAVIAYGCGHPALDGYRPTMLDRPLQAFYTDVNVAAFEGRKVLISVNNARSAYLKAYVDRAEKQLRTAE